MLVHTRRERVRQPGSQATLPFLPFPLLITRVPLFPIPNIDFDTPTAAEEYLELLEMGQSSYTGAPLSSIHSYNPPHSPLHTIGSRLDTYCDSN